MIWFKVWMELVLSPNLDHCLLVDNFWFRQNKRICFHTLTLNIVLSFSSLYPLAVLIKPSASFCWRSAQRQKLVFVAVGDGRASAEKKQGLWRAALVQGTAGRRSLWAFVWDSVLSGSAALDIVVLSLGCVFKWSFKRLSVYFGSISSSAVEQIALHLRNSWNWMFSRRTLKESF